jgi:hypothetical protein
MKKILLFSFILVFTSATASAQIRHQKAIPNFRSNSNQLTWNEKKEIRRDVVRNHMIKRRALRDGVVTPVERRRIRQSKCDTGRDLVRFRHNSRRRII